jgi:hypothetical protein
MSAATASPSAPLEQEPLSEVERVVDTFIAPTKTFLDLRRSSRWLVPWLLIAIASVALVYVVDSKVGMETVANNQIATKPKMAAKLDQLPPERRAAQIEAIAKYTRIIGYANPVVVLIVIAIFAAVFMASFNFGFGAELSFNQCLAISMYASLPGILKALIAILGIVVGGGQGFTFESPVASNLGGLVDPGSSFLHSLATSMDLFTIWTLVLTAIAYSVLTRAKRGACFGVIFGWWALVVLIGAIL